MGFEMTLGVFGREQEKRVGEHNFIVDYVFIERLLRVFKIAISEGAITCSYISLNKATRICFWVSVTTKYNYLS